jgi:L-asparaginase
MNSKSKILVIYTGGTIGSFRDKKTGSLMPVNFEKLKSLLPELDHLNVTLTIKSFENPIDSSDMLPEDWLKLLEIIEINYHKFDGFVILHGTDTMAYTASAISFLISGLQKPVIFTGSQLPVNINRTDGRENLITAIEIASMKHNGTPVIKEVCIYFEYKLFRANRTSKTSAEHFNAFESLNYPPLAEAGVHINFNKKAFLKSGKSKTAFHKKINTSVSLVKIFPGISGEIFESIIQSSNTKALVIETFGSGNLGNKPEILKWLEVAVNKGIIVVNITQCQKGSVKQQEYRAGQVLEAIGVTGGADITTEAAITKLMYLLSKNYSPHKIKELFGKSLKGEMSN